VTVLTLDRPVILDTCVLINLLASGEAEAILRSLGVNCQVCTAVRRESMYLRSESLPGQREAIDLSPLFISGILHLCDLQGQAEEGLYVGYAADLDDREAMSLAISQSRGYCLATDDRKTRKLARETGLNIVLLTTTEILRVWAELNAPAPAKLATAIQRISNRARFVPSPEDPNYSWWQANSKS